MSDLWTLGVPVGEKVVRTVLVYGGLAVLLRVAGKRNLAQLNSFDLAVRVFEGEEIPLVKNGRFVDRSLRKEGLRRADVEAALRAQNAGGAMDVAEATLSPGGSIVVWLKPEQMNATRADLAAIGARLDAIERALGRLSA